MKTTGYDSLKSWGVAVASSFINCTALLPIRISGLLFVAFQSRYDTDRPHAALFVVLLSIVSCANPFIGYLGAVFELRTILIWGSLLSSLGVAISFFAEDIIVASIFLGFLYGVGTTLQLILLPQIVKQHFTKNFATANGVTNVGSCIGSFVIIPSMTMLMDYYGVSGALLIASGVMLHSLPVAMLLRNPNYKKPEIVNEKENVPEATKDENRVLIDTCKTKKVLSSDSEEDVVDETCVAIPIADGTEKQLEAYIDDTTSCQDNPTKGLRNNNAVQENENLPNIKQRSKMRSAHMKALKTLSIFKNPPFLLIMLYTSMGGYVSMVILTVIIDVSKDKGISEKQAQFFLVIFLLAQTVGYFCLGWVTDRGYVSASKFLAIGAVGTALGCVGIVFSNSFTTIALFMILLGLSASTHASAGPSLVYDFVAESRQTMAIASRYMLYAPLSLTIGPTLRIFRETHGSYDGLLYLQACTSIVGGAVLLVLPCIGKNYKNKKQPSAK